jgi:hypothetical protein
MIDSATTVKSICFTLAAFALLLMMPQALAAEKKTVTIKSVKAENGVVMVEMDVEGQPGEMMCSRDVPNCVVPSPGKYLIATDETGRYNDCVDGVGLFPEGSRLSHDEKIGTYCLLSPEDKAVYSCPVNLTDLVSVNANIPFVTMSVKNNSGKVVTAVEIGYASIDRVGAFTTSTQSFPVEQTLKPNQSSQFSTIGAAEQIVSHRKESKGEGVIYFPQEVKFADGSAWSVEPVLHLCGAMDDGAKKVFARYSNPSQK